MVDQNEPDSLRDLQPYEAVQYTSIDLTGLAAFILKFLQEKHVATTFENVTVSLFRLFPQKFSLEGYPQYPDSARVGRTLLQLAPKYRNWATGSVQTGFALTESGMRKVEEVEQRLISSTSSSSKVRSMNRARPRTMDLNKQLQGIETSALFQKWKSGSLAEGTTLEFLTMIEAYSYTPPKALRNRVADLTQIATQSGRDEIVQFLRDVRNRFSQKFKE